MKTLLLASNNPGKLKELSALLAPLGWTLRLQNELGVPDAPEPHITFIENALAKARWASQLTGLPALADDSGLIVDVLNGAPGVRSARYANTSEDEPKDDAANNAKLLSMMSGQSERAASFVCCLVMLRYPNDPLPLIAQGQWQGQILRQAQGNQGFGYDPLFFDPQQGCSAAQMNAEVKNRISHRAKAIDSLLLQLKVR